MPTGRHSVSAHKETAAEKKARAERTAAWNEEARKRTEAYREAIAEVLATLGDKLVGEPNTTYPGRTELRYVAANGSTIKITLER